jgi:hypothetical protein
MVRQQQEQRHFLGRFACRTRPDLDRKNDWIDSSRYGPVLAILDGDCGCMDTGGSPAEKREIALISATATLVRLDPRHMETMPA